MVEFRYQVLALQAYEYYKNICRLYFFAAVLPAAADSVISVSGSLGSNVCNQLAMDSANCLVSGTASSPGSASANASVSPAPGLIALNLFARGTNASSSVNINNMDLIRVNGVTGSGSIQANFYGFDGTYLSIPGTASISPVSVTIGSYSTTFTLYDVSNDNGTFTPVKYPVVAPIDFGTLTPLNISLMGSVSSTAYDSVYRNQAFVNLYRPTFTVLDANGNVLPSASVEFYVPEPASWAFAALGLTALLLVRRRAHQQA